MEFEIDCDSFAEDGFGTVRSAQMLFIDSQSMSSGWVWSTPIPTTYFENQ